MERNNPSKAIPWLIAAIWVVVIVLAARILRDARRDAEFETAVHKEFANEVGREFIAAMRIEGDRLIVDLAYPLPRTEADNLAYGLARRLSEVKQERLGDGKACVVILQSGEPVLHLTTKKDGGLGEPVDGAP